MPIVDEAPTVTEQAPPVGPVPAPVPAVAAPAAAGPAPMTAGPEDVSRRLDQLERLVRTAPPKSEPLDDQSARRAAAAKQSEDAAVVSVDDKGFALKLPDNSYSLRIRVLVQADGRFFLADPALQANDTFLIRKFRPALDGTLFSLVDYRLVPEFAGTVQILDAYADIHPRLWLRLRVGKFKGPIGLERLQNDADLPMLERALDSNLSSQREVGVQLWGEAAGGIAAYSIGVFNGAVDGTSPDTDINHAKDLQGRLFFQPFQADGLHELGSFGFGFAGAIGNRKGRLPTSTAAAVTGLPAFKTAGQNTFFQYFAPATDTSGATTTFTHELTVHLNPQLYYYYQGIGLLAEYVVLREGVQRGNTTATLTHQAAHATLSYVLKGRVNFAGVTPESAFDSTIGSWGAIEIAARWAWLKLDPDTFGDPNHAGSVQYADPVRNPSSAQAWTGGVTWVPRRSFHLAVNLEQTYFKGGAGTAAAPADRKTESVVIGRAQVNF